MASPGEPVTHRRLGCGLELTDRAVPEHLANEARLLEPLTVAERATLATLLAWLGASLGV